MNILITLRNKRVNRVTASLYDVLKIEKWQVLFGHVSLLKGIFSREMYVIGQRTFFSLFFSIIVDGKRTFFSSVAFVHMWNKLIEFYCL